MFRLQDNTPEVYVQNSRDFQLFCRLYDVLHNGVKYNIDSLTKVSTTRECPTTLLPLLKLKLGMFSSIDASDSEMTTVLRAFPSLMRQKGSLDAIESIVTLFHRMSHDVDSPPEIDASDPNHIHIIFQSGVSNEELLKSLLELIRPAGCQITYEITKIGYSETDVLVDTAVAFKRYNLETDGVSVVFGRMSDYATNGVNTVIFNVGILVQPVNYRAVVSGTHSFLVNGARIVKVQHRTEGEIPMERDVDGTVRCTLIENGNYQIIVERDDASDEESVDMMISAPVNTADMPNTVGLTYVNNKDLGGN